jgi:CRP-like cAMP-binding protein
MNRTPTNNQFLDSLSRGDFELFRPHLREIKLVGSDILFDADGRIERVYFPTAGVISLVVVLADGDMVEAGMIGSDGVAGTPAALDGAISLNRAIVQVPGAGLSIEIAPIRAAVAASRSLRIKLYEHDQIMLAQAQQSAACNVKHDVEARLCRWLLRTRDLVKSKDINLTQEFLGQMLGVRRTSVTLAAQQLQKAGLIKYRRGTIEICDVAGLEEASCECYEAVKNQIARLAEEGASNNLAIA